MVKWILALVCAYLGFLLFLRAWNFFRLLQIRRYFEKMTVDWFVPHDIALIYDLNLSSLNSLAHGTHCSHLSIFGPPDEIVVSPFLSVVYFVFATFGMSVVIEEESTQGVHLLFSNSSTNSEYWGKQTVVPCEVQIFYRDSSISLKLDTTVQEVIDFFGTPDLSDESMESLLCYYEPDISFIFCRDTLQEVSFSFLPSHGKNRLQ
jgi:hypothetical protein